MLLAGCYPHLYKRSVESKIYPKLIVKVVSNKVRKVEAQTQRGSEGDRNRK